MSFLEITGIGAIFGLIFFIFGYFFPKKGGKSPNLEDFSALDEEITEVVEDIEEPVTDLSDDAILDILHQFEDENR